MRPVCFLEVVLITDGPGPLAPRFKWTESTVFVGRGRCCFEDGQQMVEYQIFEVGV
jgi:hypothetical protein